jgi:5-formyltetrahydrofolate cyclo-ligase
LKTIVRKELLYKRNLMTQEEIKEKSKKICKRLEPFHSKAGNIMLYLSFGSEVNTEELIDRLLEEGKKVFVPVTINKTKELLISQLKHRDKDLAISSFGILEPKKEKLRLIDPKELDLIIVPGVGFDKRGYRIGYGAGYYDRFLARISPAIPTIGLSFQVQLLEQVANHIHDYPVQFIITENQLIDCRKYSCL